MPIYLTKGARIIALALIVVMVTLYAHKITTISFIPLPKPAPRPRKKDIRNKIYESKWIKIFPHLQKMVLVVNDENPLALTSANYTKIKILNPGELQVGGLLRASISSYSEVGERKTHGGDFFQVILRRLGSDTDGVTCVVTDATNGNYNVSCILPWTGPAVVQALLLHPSEIIYQLMKRYSSEKGYKIYQDTTMLNSRNETVFTACSVGFPEKRLNELCDYSNPTHGEKRTCIKPPSGECPNVLYQRKVVGKSTFEKPNGDHLMHVRRLNIPSPISGSGITIFINKAPDKEHKNYYFTGNLSKFSLEPMTPSGWLFDGNWTSVKTKRDLIPDFETMKGCVANKRLYFFGDSTARNIYTYVVKTLHIKDHGMDSSAAWSRSRVGSSEELNMTIHYRTHGPPLNNPGPENTHPYMSDSFDAIREGGAGTIIIFTIGYHFLLFDPDVYLERIRIIKKTVLSLLSRLTGAQVIVKGLHYYQPGRRDSKSSPWLAYRLLKILRHEFYDVKGVDYMENWDFTMLLKNKQFHPPGDIFLGTIKILLSFIC